MKNKKSVAIIVKHLGEGGAQRSAAMLSLMLDKLDYEVSFIALYDDRVFTFKGEYFVLNKNNKGSKLLSKYYQFLDFKAIVKNNNFDFIIDFRGRTNFLREIIIYYFVYKTSENIIFTVRESKLENYLPYPFFVFRNFYKKAFKIMVVSKVIENSIKEKYSLQNLVTIYNGIDFDEIDKLKNEDIEESQRYILAIGRFVKLKQFVELIEVYSKSILPKKGIKLYLLGEGELEKELLKIIEEKELDHHVSLLPFQRNPYKYMSKAKFLVLSSKREGFPNVLLESLACTTPVVSFNCETGPGEIIQHEKNGLLVDDQDFNKLIIAINRMVEDEELYVFCKQNARRSVEKFDINNISLSWQDILE